MKKIIVTVIVIASFAACKNNKSELPKDNAVMIQDTFRMYNNSILTDKNQQVQTNPVKSSATQGRKSTNNSSQNTNNNTSANSTNTGSGQVATAPVKAKKKGWSHRARGAVVGAGAGAVTGAIINKNNRGAGAVIGAVVGAAGGYIIGNEVDKKNGR